MEPSHIPNRQPGDLVWLIPDFLSRELALAVREAFFNQLGEYPHFIVSNLHRSKLDLNRLIDVAAQGNAEAEQAYYEYHGFINHALEVVKQDYGKGMFVDIHRHGHSIQRLELGYLVTMDQLRLSDAELNSGAYSDSSSIHSLVNTSGMSLSELLRGPSSLGTRFESKGIPTIPSSTQPAPLPSESIFTGYGATWLYGSRNGQSSIDAVQFESHYTGVLESQQMIDDYAEVISQVVTEFVRDFYGFDLTSTAIDDELIPEQGPSISFYPNPVRNSASIKISNMMPGESLLEVYDILGRRVDVLEIPNQGSPSIQIEWRPNALTAGSYFLVLNSDSRIHLQPMVLVR